MTKQEFIESRFDIEELREVGFLKTEKTYKEIETRICQFFGLENIFMYDYIMEEKHEPVKADIEIFSIN